MQMYSAYYTSLVDAAALKINNQLADFENKFAPVPKDDNDGQWISLLMDVVSVGFSIPASRFFNSGKFWFSWLPWPLVLHLLMIANGKSWGVCRISSQTATSRRKCKKSPCLSSKQAHPLQRA